MSEATRHALTGAVAIFGTLASCVLVLIFVATMKICDALHAICDRLRHIDETLWRIKPECPPEPPKPETGGGWRHGGGSARW